MPAAGTAMPIQPKHSLGQLRPGAARQFTDRSDFLKLFQENIQAGRLSDHRILVFYGVGGIGKTSMRKEMARMLDAAPATEIYACLDFDVPSYRDQETALFALRDALREGFKVSFPTFDIAYAVYWQKIHPQTAMDERSFPLLENSNLISDIAQCFGAVPLIGLIPKLAIAATTGSKMIREWWTKRGAQELRDLPDLGPTEITERLPMFWAADLRDHMAHRAVPAALFLDTYESLWETERSEGRFHQRDEWVRELVSQLPEVLWVMFGREKLRWAEIDKEWDKHIHQYLVGGLAPADARTFLTSCGISHPEVTEAILGGSQGVPYYLDLAVDTYLEIRDRLKREPVRDDFAATPREIFARFLRHLTQTEIETLKLLSVPRLWDYRLFELLVAKYQTGYPLTGFADLCRFSFVQGKTEESWSLHQLMRESLREHMGPELNRRVHQTLFDYYNAMLTGITDQDVTAQHKLALGEAFYHGRTVLPGEQLVAWLSRVAPPFHEAAQYQLLTDIYREAVGMLEQTLGPDHSAVATALNETAELLRIRGSYPEAESLCRRALEIREQKLGPVHPDIATSLNCLTKIHHCQGRDAEAEPLCRRALKVWELAFGPQSREVAAALNNLASLASAQGKFAEAEPLLRQAVAGFEQTGGTNEPELYAPLINLAGVCLMRGSVVEAEALLRRAIEICEKARGAAHPDLASSLNSLATLYRNQRRYAEAEPLCRRALSIREETFGAEHPEVAASLNNLSLIYHHQGRDADAEPLCRRALDIREKALGLTHRDTATSLSTLAVIRQAQGDYIEAETLCRQALAVREKSLRPGHPAIANALCNLASVCEAQSKLADAEPLYQRALSIREQSLGAEHSSVAEVLDRLALLSERTGQAESARQYRERASKIRAGTNPA
jgi:tetratricopeptide (TPR) repeat protein